MNNKDIKTFTFTFDGADNSDVSDDFPIKEFITKTIHVDANATWDLVLKQFVLFLGHCWGYDIADKVSYETLQSKLDKLMEQLDEDDCKYDEPEGYTLK